jgi:hypothetical protein
MDAIDAILTASDLVAVLGREVSVRLVDISTSGCLLASDSRLETGTIGVLRVSIDDTDFADDVRVMRCQACEGSSALYHIGAQFLWTTSPDERSLRRAITRLQTASVKGARFEHRM